MLEDNDISLVLFHVPQCHTKNHLQRIGRRIPQISNSLAWNVAGGGYWLQPYRDWRLVWLSVPSPHRNCVELRVKTTGENSDWPAESTRGGGVSADSKQTAEERTLWDSCRLQCCLHTGSDIWARVRQAAARLRSKSGKRTLNLFFLLAHLFPYCIPLDFDQPFFQDV